MTEEATGGRGAVGTSVRRTSRRGDGALVAALARTAAVMVARFEKRMTGGGDDDPIEEGDVKLLAALASALAKVRDLRNSSGNARDDRKNETATGGKAGPEDGSVPQSVLDALEALVDGRAAGLARRS